MSREADNIASHQPYSNSDEDDIDQEEEDDEDEDEVKRHELDKRRSRFFGRVIDPKEKWIQEWNRVFLLVCGAGLFVDPLFFYALSISETCMCLFLDGWFALTVTALRCMTDALHVWNMWLQFKMAKPSYASYGPDADKLHYTTARTLALRYLKGKKGFFFDLFVILPIPQVVLWIAIPALLERGATTEVMTVLLIMFLFQYLPKIYHSICFLRRMQNVSGYIFGTVWWGIALNMIAYFVAAHAAGACWYLLGCQRAAKCLTEQCRTTQGCGPKMLTCEEPIYYGRSTVRGEQRLVWGENKYVRHMCIESPDHFDFGAYKWTLALVKNDSRLEKILFPIFWGLMTLSTFGNLESTTEWTEVVFNIIILTSGLLLVTMLIGNIKVFLHATTSKKQAMQLKMRNMEWWMRRRQLPPGYKQRVRQYERQRWAATRGVDECEMIRNLPEGLRRDIKYHLCLDLVRQVTTHQTSNTNQYFPIRPFQHFGREYI